MDWWDYIIKVTLFIIGVVLIRWALIDIISDGVYKAGKKLEEDEDE